jgi:aminoglycoside 6'-N-acetyltransferase/ribosomal-protein-alanine N-acetyltransferase
MAWRIESASDAFFEERATWHYEPPYDFYDDDREPVKNPERFYAVSDDAGVVGFLYLEEREADVFYGLGLRPDLTGRGLGLDFVRFGLDFAHRRFPGRRIILDVAEFNVRARKVYERAGFRLTGEPHAKPGYGDVTFVDMEEASRRTPSSGGP